MSMQSGWVFFCHLFTDDKVYTFGLWFFVLLGFGVLFIYFVLFNIFWMPQLKR